MIMNVTDIKVFVPSKDYEISKSFYKEIGFKWASKKRMWYFGEMKSKNPTPKSMEEIKSKYGSEILKSKAKKQIAS